MLFGPILLPRALDPSGSLGIQEQGVEFKDGRPLYINMSSVISSAFNFLIWRAFVFSSHHLEVMSAYLNLGVSC